jgi:cytochrome c peroxidase
MESCRKDNLLTTPKNLVEPAHFPAAVNVDALQVTAEGFLLGKRLFYDGNLSKDGHISCGSCHEQRAGFGTFDHDLSHGYNNSHSNRNAPPLFNLAWQTNFGWDGRNHTIGEVITAHINSVIDMGESIDNVVSKINKTTAYRPLFKAAFGSSDVTKDRLLNALTQFTISLVSAETKYDSVQQNKAAFTPSEQAGYNLFKANCNSCHTEPLFTNQTYRNIGLPVSDYLRDRGRMEVTGNRDDSLTFKVPSLRNLFYSYPFMHDGRFIAFSQVFDHYQSGVQNSATLDPRLVSGISLTAAERNAIIDFFRTLSDVRFINNPDYKP